MKRLPIILLTLAIHWAGLADANEDDAPLFAFGAIADCQYCDEEGTRRQYQLSPLKLEACIDDFNTQNLTHIVHLGDFIDRDWKSFDVVLPIINQANAPIRHVLGNHDFSVADEYKNQVPERLKLESRYYDFNVGKWRFLILDTNDVSLYAHPSGSERDKSSHAIYESLGGKLPTYNGAIGQAQLDWIEAKLTQSEKDGETVILHSHHPVYPYNNHTAWNSREIVALLEKHACVAAYINGHNHNGAYGFKKGIHYLTLKGMVDTEDTAYSVITIFSDRLQVKGTGRQDNYVLEIQRR